MAGCLQVGQVSSQMEVCERVGKERERVGDSRKQIKVGDVRGKEARGELEGCLTSHY